MTLTEIRNRWIANRATIDQLWQTVGCEALAAQYRRDEIGTLIKRFKTACRKAEDADDAGKPNPEWHIADVFETLTVREIRLLGNVICVGLEELRHQMTGVAMGDE